MTLTYDIGLNIFNVILEAEGNEETTLETSLQIGQKCMSSRARILKYDVALISICYYVESYVTNEGWLITSERAKSFQYNGKIAVLAARPETLLRGLHLSNHLTDLHAVIFVG